MSTTEKVVVEKVERAEQALRELAEDHEQALDLLEAFCERFYWIKDHPDFQKKVRDFLTNLGRFPRPYGH